MLGSFFMRFVAADAHIFAIFFYIQPGAWHEAQLCRTSATTVRAESRGRLPTYRVTVIYPPSFLSPWVMKCWACRAPQKSPSHQNAALTSLCASSPHQPLPTTSLPPPPRPPPANHPIPPLHPCPHPEACVWCCGHFLHRLSRQPGGVICHECSSDLLLEVVVGSYLCRVSAATKISLPPSVGCLPWQSPLVSVLLSALTDRFG